MGRRAAAALLNALAVRAAPCVVSAPGHFRLSAVLRAALLEAMKRLPSAAKSSAFARKRALIRALIEQSG